ncbi:hypothetical protein GCM10023169_37120 [Georgenia halophila]|uniref:Pyroglutamyl peptidase n=1 Tax=Georgenia halophila TaxID=620889 RepID=A0ABP8LLY3_9MICO
MEEDRLELRLPDDDDASLPQSVPFAELMIHGGGFEDVVPILRAALDTTTSAEEAGQVAAEHGSRLWRAAVDRAQGRVERGNLPASDDRPLYWTRVLALLTIRLWPGPDLTAQERDHLRDAFDRASRGMTDIDFPDGRARVLVGGFDPYTLDGGDTGTTADAAGNNLRHGNPSGAAALALDGTSHTRPDGTEARIEAYILPVRYTAFDRGYLEDTVGPWMRSGPKQVHASLTLSQGGGSEFHLEEFNARYRGARADNEGVTPAAPVDGRPQLATDNPDANIQIPVRLGGRETFDLHDPPQWTRASLPVEQMIAASSGADVTRPPRSTWPDGTVAYGVVWNTRFTEFPEPSSSERVARNDPVPHEYPPPEAPVEPSAGSASYRGGGGNYLSNESAYRNTLLRDRMGLDIPAGHIHTPDMQHFGSDFAISDDTFDVTRRAIVQQAVALVRVVGDLVPATRPGWTQGPLDSGH